MQWLSYQLNKIKQLTLLHNRALQRPKCSSLVIDSINIFMFAFSCFNNNVAVLDDECLVMDVNCLLNLAAIFLASDSGFYNYRQQGTLTQICLAWRDKRTLRTSLVIDSINIFMFAFSCFNDNVAYLNFGNRLRKRPIVIKKLTLSLMQFRVSQLKFIKQLRPPALHASLVHR